MSDAEPLNPRPLPVGRILWGAVAQPCIHARAVVKAVGLPVPAIVMLSAWQAGTSRDNDAIVLTQHVLSLLLNSWLAINVYRLVLMEGVDARPRMNMRDLEQFGIFAFVLLVLWLAGTTLVKFLLTFFHLALKYAPGGHLFLPEQTPWIFFWHVALALFLAALLIGRFALMLPGIAAGRLMNPVAAWRTSSGNAWRLAVVLVVPLLAKQLILSGIVPEEISAVQCGLLSLLASIFLIIEVIVLSLSYWELTSPGPLPTHPYA